MNNKIKFAEKIQFEHGYAVGKQKIKELKQQPWGKFLVETGEKQCLLNENMEIIIPFSSSNDEFNIFPEGNILVRKRKENPVGRPNEVLIENYHYIIRDNKIVDKKNLYCRYYNQINNTTIVIDNYDYSDKFVALYDVVKQKLVSNKFSKIDNFKQVTEKNEEEYAKATIELPINSNGNVLGEIICYIDKMGNIRTPLYNTCDGLYIDTDSQDFNLEEVIENINTKLLGSILEKEEALNTLKNNL